MNEKGPGCGSGAFSKKALPSCGGLRKLGSAAQPRFLPVTALAVAPPANLSLASGQVAR